MKKKVMLLLLGAAVVSINAPLFSISFKYEKQFQKEEVKENIDNMMALSDVFAVGASKQEYQSHYDSKNIEDKIKNIKGLSADEKLTFLSAFRYVSSLPQSEVKETEEHEKVAKATLALYAFGNENTLKQLAKHIHKGSWWGNKKIDTIVKNFMDQRPLSPTSFLSTPGVALLTEIKNTLPEYQTQQTPSSGEEKSA
jgi:hypothetical protein